MDVNNNALDYVYFELCSGVFDPNQIVQQTFSVVSSRKRVYNIRSSCLSHQDCVLIV